MISIERLEETTNEFCEKNLFNLRPNWSPKWKFRGELPI